VCIDSVAEKKPPQAGAAFQFLLDTYITHPEKHKQDIVFSNDKVVVTF
jgi:hypothetical protein